MVVGGAPLARPTRAPQTRGRRHPVHVHRRHIACILISSPLAAEASENRRVDELQAAYDRYSGKYDELDGGAAAQALGWPKLRSELVAMARGDTLEVAVGTGMNLPLYREEVVARLTALDVSEGMLEAARQRVARLGSAGWMKLVQGDALALPFADGSFDTVLDTFSLCVLPDPNTALKEMLRVLRPGGRLLLLEHSRSPNRLLASYQDMPLMVEKAGFSIRQLQRPTAGLLALIVAEKPAGSSRWGSWMRHKRAAPLRYASDMDALEEATRAVPKHNRC